MSCEKTITLDINESKTQISIEGQVTDVPGYQYVKVSRSVDFYSSGKTPRVTDATVVMNDDEGNVYTFIHNPNNHADSLGYYLPETPFTGVVGRTYTLNVMVDGVTYTAHDKIYRVVPIDKLEYDIDQDEKDDPEIPGRYYELLITVKEPKETKDYYLFKAYRNDSLTYDSDTDVYYADDELIGENIDGLPLPVYYSMNDKARIEVYSLSREAYIFYRDLEKVLNNDGGLFGQPPSNPRSNFNNNALGLFQASSMAQKSLVVGE
jgi:hypothetical protein